MFISTGELFKNVKSYVFVEIPVVSRTWPVADEERSVDGPAADSVKPLSQSAPVSMSLSPQNLSLETQRDVQTFTEIHQLDSMTFSQSQKSIRSNSSCHSSPGAAPSKDFARSSPLASSLSSPESRQPSSFLPAPAAEQVVKDSTGVSGMEPPTARNQPSEVAGSPASALPLSAVSSRKSCPGSDMLDSEFVRTSKPSTGVSSAPVSTVVSPLSRASGPRHSSVQSSCVNLPGSSDSSATALAEKSAGRGRKLLTLLMGQESKEVGATASRSCPNVIGTESVHAAGPSTVSYGSNRPQTLSEEHFPEQIVLTTGLDDDNNVHIEQFSRGNGQQLVAENLASTKPSNGHENLDMPVNANVPSKLAVNNTALTEDVISNSPAEPQVPNELNSPSVLLPRDNLSDGQAICTTPGTQPKNDQLERSQTPSSCDSPVPLEQSLGLSSDLSLCGDRMLTKRLPRMASRSSSRRTTPVPPSTPNSLPAQSSGCPTPCDNSPGARSISGISENGDHTPKGLQNPVNSLPPVTANKRYFV